MKPFAWLLLGAIALSASAPARAAEPARWPEDLGAIDAEDAETARARLDRAIAQAARGDRISEAHLLRALLQLEPLPDQDVEAARAELQALSATPEAGAARYVLAWLHERTGQFDRAYDAYHRVVIDSPPDDEAALRALVGIARIELRRGNAGRAARWLEQAIDGRVAPALRAESLRELALRRLLPEGPAAAGAGAKVLTGIRAVSDLAPLSDGVLLASARDGRVVRLDAEGVVVDEWTVEGLEAFAADPDGRPYVAAAQALWRLLPGGEQREVAAYGEEWSPVQALAAGGLGELWLLDRRGQRVARAAPGQPTAEPFWEDREVRLLDLGWNGAELVALDGRSRTLIALDRDGTSRVIPTAPLTRPVALATDPAGTIGVLDVRQDQVSTTTARAFAPSAVGVTKPVALGFGSDGAVHLFDDADGGWYREP